MGKTDGVSEAFLEMHYHHALVNLFAETFDTTFLRLLKPTPNKEAYVGFDQGWARTTLTADQLERELANAISHDSKSVPVLGFGYFLQFKVVEKMTNSSGNIPNNFSTPYFRAELDLRKNKKTGRSQHQTLLRLQGVMGADVNYACPMIFSDRDVWNEADLDTLRIVPLKGVRDEHDKWAIGERHFICFQKKSSAPNWCSRTPRQAVSLTPRQWLSKKNPGRPEPMSAEQLSLFIKTLRDTRKDWGGRTSGLPASFTILLMSKNRR